jgi:hypothetical protein
MSVSHDIQITRKNGATSVSKTITVASGSAIRIDEAIPIGATNLPVALAFAFAKLKYIWICSDKALTLEFNSSTTGVPTIVLEANKPFLWESTYGAVLPNPFTADVTQLFVTNGSGVQAQLQIDGLVDPT